MAEPDVFQQAEQEEFNQAIQQFSLHSPALMAYLAANPEKIPAITEEIQQALALDYPIVNTEGSFPPVLEAYLHEFKNRNAVADATKPTKSCVGTAGNKDLRDTQINYGLIQDVSLHQSCAGNTPMVVSSKNDLLSSKILDCNSSLLPPSAKVLSQGSHAALHKPAQIAGAGSPTQWGSRSFADVVRPKNQFVPTPVAMTHNPNADPSPNIMKPHKHGDFYSIEIDEEIYQQGVAQFQDCLIGRLMLSQGDKPYSTLELGKKLQEVWHMKGNLELIPHSRGYYTIRFSLLEDRDRIFKRRHWTLKPGGLRLQSWVKNFNPNRVCSSLAQVWVRLTDLPMEYWHPSILEAMASAFGTLIRIDVNTLHRRMGHYARILVEIDLKNELIEKILYKRVGTCSFATFVFERLPMFCRNCGIVGHATEICNKGKQKAREGESRKSSRERGRRRSTSRNRQMEVADSQHLGNGLHEFVEGGLHGQPEAMQGNKILALQPIHTVNAFEALNEEEANSVGDNPTDTEQHSKQCCELALLDARQIMDSPRVSPNARSPMAHDKAPTPQVHKPHFRDTTVPTGTSINKYFQSQAGSYIMAPRRTLISVVDDTSTSAQEPFVVGSVREQNLVAREPWSDKAEQEAFKKSLKHGFRIRKNRL